MSVEGKEVIVAYCRLVCSKCGAYIKGRCKGCFSDKPMNWHCKVKKCNLENGYQTCADCTGIQDFKQCKKLNNLIAKIFAFIFRSNRMASLESIRRDGLEKFKQENN